MYKKHSMNTKCKNRNVTYNPQQLSNADVDSIMMVQPKGKPVYIWFKQDENGNRAEMYERFYRPYSKITSDYNEPSKTITTSFHPFLTQNNGTIIKATILYTKNRRQILVVREVIWFKGKYVFNEPCLPILYQFAQYIKPVSDHYIIQSVRNLIPIYLPLMIPSAWLNSKQLSSGQKHKTVQYLDSLPYICYDVLNANNNTTTSNMIRIEWSKFRKQLDKLIPWRRTFIVSKEISEDTYRLYSKDKNKSFEIVINNIRESRMMNRWFETVYGINCLDDIEESDNECDETISECEIEFEKNGKQWIPLRLISKS